jgi:hypothetical protein
MGIGSITILMFCKMNFDKNIVRNAKTSDRNRKRKNHPRKIDHYTDVAGKN